MEKKEIPMTKVLHDSHTAESKRENGEAWITYWKRCMEKKVGHTISIPTYCNSCKQTLDKIKTNQPDLKEVEMVGAHVYKWMCMANPQRTIYIVPTCNICNNTYPNGTRHILDVPSDYLIEAKESDD